MICFIIGLLLSVPIVYITYKYYKKSRLVSKEDFIGKSVQVFTIKEDGTCTGLVNVPLYTEIKCKSKNPVKEGDILIIESYENGIYNISEI